MQFSTYLKQYLFTKKGNTINGIQYRFEKWLLNVFSRMFYVISGLEVKPILQLNIATGEVIESGLTAFQCWEKGKETTRQNKSKIDTINCFWGTELAIRTCEICGSRQPVFILCKTTTICFECYIGNSKSDSFRETIKKMYDARGNKIKIYTKYITPRRNVVFFDRDCNRMIYMSGITEIPMSTEYLYRL
ncbi:MAG TPA: hypothetical protein DCR40_10090 [Prolixibacteraceae bacterium]|nr:hypothetical protein [Prolixibacteraceae bacterium]